MDKQITIDKDPNSDINVLKTTVTTKVETVPLSILKKRLQQATAMVDDLTNQIAQAEGLGVKDAVVDSLVIN